VEKVTRITTPLTDDVLEKLHIGDRVLITGTLFTARDAAHKRLAELVQDGKALPFDIKGAIIYYVGPTPPKPGRVIGSAGPTSSYRMDSYSPLLIAQGLKGMIGKGARGKPVVEAMKKYKAVYFVATGGAGALISKTIKKAEVVTYGDLGAEAIRKLEVENFPVLVANDIYGHDLYEEGWKRYKKV
jgi:fumarate hydratase subunit beta